MHSTIILIFKLMKRSFYLIVALLCTQISIVAQSNEGKIRELGINLSGSTFGLRYKAGNENTLLRLTLISISGSSYKYKSSTSTSRNNSIGLGFNFGFEKRKIVSDGLIIYYGSDFLTSVNKEIHKTDLPSITHTYLTISPGIGFVLGFCYNISDKINIAAEVMPSVSYSYIKETNETEFSTTKYTNSGLNYGLKTSGINLTLSFAIGK